MRGIPLARRRMLEGAAGLLLLGAFFVNERRSFKPRTATATNSVPRPL